MRLPSLLKKFWQRIRIVLLFVFITFVCIVLLTILNNRLTIDHVEVRSNSSAPPLYGLANIKNHNIIFFSEKKTEQLLLTQNPKLKTVVVSKKLPRTIIVDIDMYQPIALLKTNQGYLALSDDGKIIYKQHELDTAYPLINYYQQFDYQQMSPGTTLGYSDITLSLRLLKVSIDLGLPILTVDISGLDMIAFVMNDKKILFTTEKAESQQRYELEQIIRQFKIEGKNFKNLDLRFDKPVISF